ncbi:MAG: TVP38/TMEM64 family protein [Gammaproteobacteria bacterium]|nr:TVP38/TMEM64 family protein [Gammaproteobacteria bacterium]
MKKLWPLLLLVLAILLAWSFDLQRLLSFDALRDNRQLLSDFVSRHAAVAGLIYVATYALATALSLPGGAILSVAGGFLFGGWLAGLYVVLGATLGATGVFLIARSSLGDLLRQRAGPWLARMEIGFQRDAMSYLLMLRLIPLFPFFVVNLVPAFLGVRLWTYVIATAVGIIPGVLVFTFTGAGLGAVFDRNESFSVSAVFTPEIIAALVGLGLLSLLPVLYKRYRGRRPQ